MGLLLAQQVVPEVHRNQTPKLAVMHDSINRVNDDDDTWRQLGPAGRAASGPSLADSAGEGSESHFARLLPVSASSTLCCRTACWRYGATENLSGQKNLLYLVGDRDRSSGGTSQRDVEYPSALPSAAPETTPERFMELWSSARFHRAVDEQVCKHPDRTQKPDILSKHIRTSML
eukprot:3368127-Amphidinium_carterae.1